ncbi:Uma2 family endonuclease [Spirosoma endophyticum]|uniref:Endonuclease, Uma2 family (Restriction endonuclease fold) n=1 Tax=Spirosoma endophyticum TaxID=662367 RepID=A0A1I1U5Y7_9BACT|nr:Uma2 family endonuclease [Spirosoma endophyticum]SFD64123.1 Endonuclease, Uma2 family (restriction endonuclease fold) [Spirosoma endophyticum]
MITDISQLDPNGTYTYADYLKWQFDESVELIKGKIYRMSPAPKRAHQLAVSHLLVDISLHFSNDSCQIYTAPFDVRLPVRNERKPDQLHTVVQPDICVICDLSKLDDNGCLGAPDWVIEIISPRTARNDFNDKFNLYQESGVREYWIVQPKEKAVNVYVLEDGEYALVDVYESGEIPSCLFPDLLVSHDRIFR